MKRIKFLVTLSLMVMMSSITIAQEIHDARVVGVVSLSRRDFATIINLTTNELYKTAVYRRGLLVANEDVQLDFSNDPTLGTAKVIKAGLNRNIFAFKEVEDGLPTENNNALSFDGVDDYIQTSTPVLDQIAGGDFTFEAWINADEAVIGNHPTIFCNRPNMTLPMKVETQFVNPLRFCRQPI